MLTVYMTVGLPGSGKSTLAHQMVRESDGLLVEVSKDDLRLRADAPASLRKRERWVVARRDEIVRAALASNRSVICHDTNLNPVHHARLSQLAAEFDAVVETLDLTGVDLHECIRRDAARAHPVGETVIRRMWQQYLYEPPRLEQASGLEEVVIVDVDGTVARMVDRGPYDFTRVHTDEPISHVVDLVRLISANGTRIIFMSGRDESCRQATQEWLDAHVGVPGDLFMRPAGDTRPDSLVKHELYQAHVQGRFTVRFVLDDRDQVVYMWRTLAKVPVLQVDYGTF